MIRLILFIAFWLPLACRADEPKLKTIDYLRLTLETQKSDTILLTQTSIDGNVGYFLSYTAGDRLLKKTALDKNLHSQLNVNFKRALSESRQKDLLTYTTTCGQPLSLKTKSVERTMCLDLASPQEREAIAKWWREVRSLLRI